MAGEPLFFYAPWIRKRPRLRFSRKVQLLCYEDKKGPVKYQQLRYQYELDVGTTAMAGGKSADGRLTLTRAGQTETWLRLAKRGDANP